MYYCEVIKEYFHCAETWWFVAFFEYVKIDDQKSMISFLFKGF